MRVRIMRGPPGSGKSHFGTVILPRIFGVDSYICSADDYFVNLGGGTYKFDANYLKLAHKESKRLFLDAMAGGAQPELVVVDNTNTMPTEIAFYYDLATLFTDDIEILTICPPPIMSEKDWLEQCFIKNSHGVPMKSIQSMNERIKKHKVPYYWREKLVTRQDGFFLLNGERYAA